MGKSFSRRWQHIYAASGIRVSEKITLLGSSVNTIKIHSQTVKVDIRRNETERHDDTPGTRLPSRTSQDALTPAQEQREALVYAAVSVALSGVPYLGAAFNELRSYRAQQFMESRLTALDQELKRRMERVSEDAVNKDYLKSEAFLDLARKAVETVLRTRDREKIAYIASILKGASINSDQENHLAEDLAEEYLYLVSDLTPQELRVARALYHLQQGKETAEEGNKLETWKVQRDELSREYSIDVSDLSVILNRLAATGVVDTVLINVPGSPQPTYRPSATFDRLMRLLELELLGA